MIYQKVILLLLVLGFSVSSAQAERVNLLNASYDPTREMYEAFNQIFASYWQEETGQDVRIRQSHGGSGSQARSLSQGMAADVATLALAYDLDVLHQRGQLIPEDWQARLPHNSSPYTSTIVFLVRQGNPKSIEEWDDLIRDGVEVITPNPRTSGGARWNYLAAWGQVLQNGGSAEEAREFVKQLYAQVPVMDSAARSATNSFVQRGLGDVFLAWENEALMVTEQIAPGRFEIIRPQQSILAEPPVTLLDRNVDRRGTRDVAQAYLEYLYSEPGQQLVAEHYFRPVKASTAEAFSERFPAMDLFTLDEVFGNWQQVQDEHFSSGGVLDQLLRENAGR